MARSLGKLAAAGSVIAAGAYCVSSTSVLCERQVQAGELFLWGGGTGDCFGGGTTAFKFSRPVDGLPEVVDAAIGCKYGVAVSAKGDVYALHRRPDSDTMYAGEAERIETVGGTITSVAVSPQDEILMTTGRGYLQAVSRTDETFATWEKPRYLAGDLKRAHISSVTCGTGHCIALSKFGEAFSWGRNKHGQLGHGNMTDDTVDAPKRIGIPAKVKIVKASCGDNHTALLDSEGHVWSFGSDQWGQAGHSEQPWTLDKHGNGTPRIIEKLQKKLVHDIACGGEHTVVVVKDGTAYTFGLGRWGQLGHHNYVHFYAIHVMQNLDGTGKLKAESAAAGTNHTTIMMGSKQIYACGANEFGQLGNGSLQPSALLSRLKGEARTGAVKVINSRDTSAAIIRT
mmetsp:Transcript_2233/g.6661  ORF Transcript_2233/g.6661 Transcript_2233/m.6661 type:complete len:398 (+) Transcript_2233:102-1295(+)